MYSSTKNYATSPNVPTENADLAYMTASVIQHLYTKADNSRQKNHDLHLLTCSIYEAFQLVRLPASIAHLATFYTYKIIKLCPKMVQKYTPFHLFIIAYSLADTHLDDNAYSNRSWVQVIRKEMNIKQWNASQISVLQHGLNWSLEVDVSDWKSWMNWLDSYWWYFQEQCVSSEEEEEYVEEIGGDLDSYSNYSSSSLIDSGYEEEDAQDYFKAKPVIQSKSANNSHETDIEEENSEKGWKGLWKQAVRRKFRWTL